MRSTSSGAELWGPRSLLTELNNVRVKLTSDLLVWKNLITSSFFLSYQGFVWKVCHNSNTNSSASVKDVLWLTGFDLWPQNRITSSLHYPESKWTQRVMKLPVGVSPGGTGWRWGRSQTDLRPLRSNHFTLVCLILLALSQPPPSPITRQWCAIIGLTRELSESWAYNAHLHKQMLQLSCRTLWILHHASTAVSKAEDFNSRRRCRTRDAASEA